MQPGTTKPSAREGFVSFRLSSKVLPQKYVEGNKLPVERAIKSCLDVLPNLEKASFGRRLRFLRKRRGLTIVDLEKRTGVSRVTICRIERGHKVEHLELAGKLLGYFGAQAAEAFPPGTDPIDLLVPVTDFGSWLRNFRVRKGLQQAKLAEILGVSRPSISCYEANKTTPLKAVLKKLRKSFKLARRFDRFL